MQLPNSIYTIPNAISLTRALLGPVAMTLIVNNTRSSLTIALVILIIAESSDFLDGMIARQFNQVSEFGKYFDPVSDSIYRLSVFLAFLSNGWMPAWIIFLIYSRDLIVPYLRTFARQFGGSLNVRWSGKLKAVSQGLCQIAVVAIALDFISIYGDKISDMYLFLSIAAVVTLLSLLDYIYGAFEVINK